jgi:hypothetical protein
VEPTLADIGEQFAWLGAACRTSGNDTKMAFSTVEITTIKSPGLHFKLTFSIEDLALEDQGLIQNGTCWHSLFKNSVIVKGYPILARLHGERGLEIPLNMMAGLADAPFATNFDGRLVIKGFSTMFVPTQCTPNSVLWHFLYENDGGRISYLSACDPKHYPSQALTKRVESLHLTNTRHFLGWTSSAVLLTGKLCYAALSSGLRCVLIVY